MKFTNVEIVLVKPKNGLVAFASFVLNESVCLNSIAIHSKLSGDGYRLTYPMKSGRYLCCPVNKEASKLIESLLINEFKKVIKQDDRYCRSFNP